MSAGMFDVVVKGGTVVTERDTFVANVGIQDGKIASLASCALEARHTLDATGQLVLPGLIDAHVHMQPRMPGANAESFIEWSDDFASGSASAACGGVTTFVDFAVQEQAPGATAQEVVEHYKEIASKTSAIDFALHAGLTYPAASTLAEIPKLVDMGVPTFKFYRTYKRWGIYVDLGFLREALGAIAKAGGMAAIHCEQDEVLSFLRSEYIAAGLDRDLTYHARSRPPVAEEIAIDEVAALAREQGAPAYVVHLNSRLGLDAVRRAKQRQAFFAEAGLHFLVFTDEVFARPDAALFFMTPPFRTEEDREALWEGLADGSIDWIATDHSPHLRAEKLADPRFSPSDEGLEFAIPPGFTGIEEMLPLVYTLGVVGGRFSVSRLVALLATNPARALGLQHKGAIELGKDADLVIFDPQREATLTASMLHTKADYTIYDGIKVRGLPTLTLLRGEVVAHDGQLVGKSGGGKFVPRKLDW